MVRLFLAAALAIGGVLAVPRVAAAQSQSCNEFRDSIVKMERESVRPPGWMMLDSHLRLIYERYCIRNPTPERPVEYWYRADGTSTGVAVGEDRPADGAYATTQEIGEHCLKQAGDMIRNAQGHMVRAGMDPSICALLQASIREKPAATPGAPLPPLEIAGLDPNSFHLDQVCLATLSQFGKDLALDNDRAWMRPGYLVSMRKQCPGFVASVERHAGVGADDASGRFWESLGQLLMTPPAAAGQTPTNVLAVAVDPGWQRMCREAEANANQCKVSHENIRSLGTEPLGVTGQAGAFNECRMLYDRVLGMCNGTTGAAMNATAAKAKAINGTSMSAQCQQLVSSLVAAAKAGDGPQSVAAHEALKQAGGCGVLDKVAAQATPPASSLPSRGARPMLNTYVDQCDQHAAACANAVAQARRGASPEATAALWSQSISIGLQVGAILGTGVLMYQYSRTPSSSAGGGGTTATVGAAPPPRGSIQNPQGLPANRSTISGSTR